MLVTGRTGVTSQHRKEHFTRDISGRATLVQDCLALLRPLDVSLLHCQAPYSLRHIHKDIRLVKDFNMFDLDEGLPPILQLPSELRLQIYGYVMGNRVVHVRMTWKGICIPAGFAYACLDDTNPLLEPHESLLLSHAVPFGSNFHSLNTICRQIHGETAPLPFTSYTWAFETAFTLDNWVSMKSQIPDQFKNAVRTVAVPSPGPFRSSERILWNLQEVLLIGSFSPRSVTVEGEESKGTPNRAILRLRKDRASNTWIRSGERIRDLKGAFEATGSGNPG